MGKVVKTKYKWMNFAEARADFKDKVAPRQFLFTIEVILKDKDTNDLQLEDALYSIRELGGVAVTSISELHADDERRL